MRSFIYLTLLVALVAGEDAVSTDSGAAAGEDDGKVTGIVLTFLVSYKF